MRHTSVAVVTSFLTHFRYASELTGFITEPGASTNTTFDTAGLADVLSSLVANLSSCDSLAFSLGNVSVQIGGGPMHAFANATNGTCNNSSSAVATVTYTGSLADEIVGDSELGELASGVVEVLGAHPVPVVITIDRPTIEPGGGACVTPPLFAAADPNTTCAAGCCNETGYCGCSSPNVRGAHCETELSCSLVDGPSGPAAEAASVCHTMVNDDGTEVQCSCSRVGMLAVFLHRVRPRTSIDSSSPERLLHGLALHPGRAQALGLGV